MEHKYLKYIFVYYYIINTVLGSYIPEKEQLDQLIIKNIEIGNKKDNEIIIIHDKNLKNDTYYYNIFKNDKDNNKNNSNDEKNTKNKIEVYIKIILGAILGAIIGYFIAPFMIFIGLTLLGFTAVGVVFGSIAAWIMSLYGGTIASGSIVAILQSMGALGFLNLFGGGCGLIPGIGSIIGIIVVEYIVLNFCI